jgi:hypothetical protein
VPAPAPQPAAAFLLLFPLRGWGGLEAVELRCPQCGHEAPRAQFGPLTSWGRAS